MAFGRFSSQDALTARDDVLLETVGYIKGVNHLGYDRQEQPVKYGKDAQALAARIDGVLKAEAKTGQPMSDDERTLLTKTYAALGQVAETSNRYGILRRTDEQGARRAAQVEFRDFRRDMDRLAHNVYVDGFVGRYESPGSERPLTATQEAEVGRIEWNSNPNIR